MDRLTRWERGGGQSDHCCADPYSGLAGGDCDSVKFLRENRNRPTAHPISPWDLEIDRPMLESRFLKYDSESYCTLSLHVG